VEFLLFSVVFLLRQTVRLLERRMVKQKHVRFDPTKADTTSTEQDCFKELVPASVAKSSLKQYNSRLNTLCGFLRQARGVTEVHPVSTTRQEFLQFLKSWKAQGLGDPEAVRDALLKLQLSHGMANSFLEEKPVIMAVRGATGKAGPDKHVLEKAEQTQYEDFILNCKDKGHLGGCRNCRMRLDSKQGRLTLLWASRFIQAIPCRLMNLREFKGFHLEAEKERVFVEHLKTEGGGPGYLPCGKAGQQTFTACFDLAKGSYGDYLFPTCVQKHLTCSLQSAAEVFGWDSGLVHTGYCLRHTGMRSRKVSIQEMLESQEGGVSVGTVRIYNRDNAKRRKCS